MTVTVMKTALEKLKPYIIHYRDYRKFSNDKFRENLISRLPTENIRVDVNIINRETIAYHFYETNYYANLDKKNLTDNKHFWRTVNLYFQIKSNRLKK